jgi:hypothetical protein
MLPIVLRSNEVAGLFEQRHDIRPHGDALPVLGAERAECPNEVSNGAKRRRMQDAMLLDKLAK